jgi:hypothetical protein
VVVASVVAISLSSFCRIRLPADLLRLVRLKDLLALLAGANADGFLDCEDEDLPVPDRARAGVLEDHLLHDLEVVGLHDDLHLELGPQVDGQLPASDAR